MLNRIHSCALAFLLATLVALPPVRAQGEGFGDLTRPVAHSFAELRQSIKSGQRLVVRHARGKVTGSLVRFTPEGLSLLVSGQRREIREDEVTEIRQRRTNGALIGACVGGGLALYYYYGGDGGTPVGVAAVLFGGGLGIGLAWDALVPGRLLYHRVSGGLSGSLRLVPLLTPTRRGVLASVRF
jgi:hypothetical protein